MLKQVSYNQKYIIDLFLSTTNEMQHNTMFFIVVSTLHVSSGFSAHHQELKTVHVASVLVKRVLLPLACLSRNSVLTQAG
jgi:hypothetical protein